MDQIQDWMNMLDPRVVTQIMQVLRLTAWLTILSVVFIPLERLFALHPKKIFRRGVLTDVGYYFMNGIALGFLLSFPMAIMARGVHHVIPVGFTAAVAAWPVWLRICGAMVVGEIGSYWGHRWTHQIPFLWRFHAIHHSAEDVDFLVSAKGHPVDLVFTRLCELTPMYMLGLASPLTGSGNLVPLIVIIFGTVWGYFIHANVTWRFGPLEWLISTPAFHHWHHTNDGPEVINKNYAPMLPWVDKLFGTLYLPKDKHPQKYGLDEPISPILFGQLVDPFMVWKKVRPEPGGASTADGGKATETPAGVDPSVDSEPHLIGEKYI